MIREVTPTKKQQEFFEREGIVPEGIQEFVILKRLNGCPECGSHEIFHWRTCTTETKDRHCSPWFYKCAKCEKVILRSYMDAE